MEACTWNLWSGCCTRWNVNMFCRGQEHTGMKYRSHEKQWNILLEYLFFLEYFQQSKKYLINLFQYGFLRPYKDLWVHFSSACSLKDDTLWVSTDHFRFRLTHKVIYKAFETKKKYTFRLLLESSPLPIIAVLNYMYMCIKCQWAHRPWIAQSLECPVRER